MRRHHARVAITGPGRATVELDGQEVQGIAGFTIKVSTTTIASLTLDVVVPTGEINGQTIVVIPNHTAATLAALGWTPPPEQEVPDAPAHG